MAFVSNLALTLWTGSHACFSDEPGCALQLAIISDNHIARATARPCGKISTWTVSHMCVERALQSVTISDSHVPGATRHFGKKRDTSTVSQRRLSQMRRNLGSWKRSAATSKCCAMAQSRLLPSSSCTNTVVSRLTSKGEKRREFMIVSDHDGSLLRRQPGAALRLLDAAECGCLSVTIRCTPDLLDS